MEIKQFKRTLYGQEHKLVVLSPRKPKIPVEVLSFEEEFEHYLSMTKKFYWRNYSGFMLEYNSPWEDLKKAWYVYPTDDNIKNLIIKKFKVIEIC